MYGLSVHLSILSRIHSILPKDIQNYSTFLQSGVFFPDAFYNCLGKDDAAESTHWPNFLKTSIEYYKQKSKQLKLKNQDNISLYYKDEEINLLELKAFIYGVLAHQVTDVSWHSLGVNQGLLEMLTEMDFDGDNQKAHT